MLGLEVLHQFHVLVKPRKLKRAFQVGIDHAGTHYCSLLLGLLHQEHHEIQAGGINQLDFTEIQLQTLPILRRMNLQDVQRLAAGGFDIGAQYILRKFQGQDGGIWLVYEVHDQIEKLSVTLAPLFSCSMDSDRFCIIINPRCRSGS